VTATLKVSHTAIGAEVRRAAYEVIVDGRGLGRIEMNGTLEMAVDAGSHSLQVRSGRNSSSTRTFEASEGETISYRATGKRFLPIFLASFLVPSLALALVRQ
jgi:hypothetical protein